MAAYLLGRKSELGRRFVSQMKPEEGREIQSGKACNHEIHIVLNKRRREQRRKARAERKQQTFSGNVSSCES